jgi:hypothetical protein
MHIFPNRRKHLAVFSLLLFAAAAVAQQRAPQPITLPIELANNHTFVQVRVNDSPLWFLFDTGAGQSMLDMRNAKRLSLKLGQAFQAQGAGANLIAGSFLEGATLTLPHVNGFSHPMRLALPFEPLESLEGRRVDGVLGYEFIRRFVVEVDYSQRQMRLHDKQAFVYSGQGETLPLTFVRNHPHLRATIQPANGAPIEADFVLDLGARSALILTTSFVEKHKLLATAPTTIEALIGRGVGGDVQLRITRMKSFRLGSFEFAQPIVGLAQEEKGALGRNASFEGNLGAEIMRRFRVFLDYERARLILEPNGQLAEPFEYDMSGAAMEFEGANFERLKITRLSANTPATQAGLQIGDRIERLDDKTILQLGVNGLRQALLKEGARTLTIKRGEQTMQVRLQLKRRI